MFQPTPTDRERLSESTRPRCPPNAAADSVDDLLPYLHSVAKRPYHHGLHAAWDLRENERVLLRVDNWHDPLAVEAVVRTLKDFACDYEVLSQDRGPIPRYDGHDEFELMRDFTSEIAGSMKKWEELSRSGKYDKLLWGFGGPVLAESDMLIQRMPFITPEMIASPAHTLPAEILAALDDWTWRHITNAARVRITDPEGTDIAYTNHSDYYSDDLTTFNHDIIQDYFPQNVDFASQNYPGHVWGRPWFYLPGMEDGRGVIAGTMNHVGPFPYMRLEVENAKITAIEGEGAFAEKLRAVASPTEDKMFPGHPGKGMMYWWEASIGTNPKIHRPRKDYLLGWSCALYERMRSGVIHMGFGTILSSDKEREAFEAGLPVGHWHIHLYFPTVHLEMRDGTSTTLIADGRLLGLDDPEIRAIAAKYGDPDHLLSEDWIPAVPGLNMDGDYWTDYAQDPTDWTLTELKVCRKWHSLYMRMVGAGHSH